MAKLSRRLCVEGLETRRLFAVLTGPAGASFGTTQHESSTEEVSVAVAAENLSGVRAAEFQFRYETSDLNVDRSDVKLGAAWQGKASVVTHVNERAGTINVFVYSASPIVSTFGELLEFDVEVVDALAHDVASRIELTRFELNEGRIQSLPKLLFEPVRPPFASMRQPEVTPPVVMPAVGARAEWRRQPTHDSTPLNPAPLRATTSPSSLLPSSPPLADQSRAEWRRDATTPAHGLPVLPRESWFQR